jgi:hypothetical protein
MMGTYSLDDNAQLRQLMDNLTRHPSFSEEKYQRLVSLLQTAYNLTVEESLHWINHWIEQHTPQ